MCLNSNSNLERTSQAGFLLPLALFIIVALGLLSLVLGRLVAQAGSSVTQGAVTAQGLYAADSGLQWALNRLYYEPAGGTAVDMAETQSRCSSIQGSSLTYTVDGLKQCSTTISCSSSLSSDGNRRIFTLGSLAQCDAGNLGSRRQLQVTTAFSGGVL